MKADEKRGNGRAWARWLEPLRPDDVTRRRIRDAVMERARPLLSARPPAGAWEVAAGWADVLVPVAAVASVLFGMLALRTDRGALNPTTGPGMAAGEGVRIEELLVGRGADDPPALLTRQSQPDLDGLLEATISYAGER